MERMVGTSIPPDTAGSNIRCDFGPTGAGMGRVGVCIIVEIGKDVIAGCCGMKGVCCDGCCIGSDVVVKTPGGGIDVFICRGGGGIFRCKGGGGGGGGGGNTGAVQLVSPVVILA